MSILTGNVVVELQRLCIVRHLLGQRSVQRATGGEVAGEEILMMRDVNCRAKYGVDITEGLVSHLKHGSARE